MTVADTEPRTSNSEIAAVLDMSVSGVSRLRSGTRNASVAIAGRIIETYCLTPDQRFLGIRALAKGGTEQADFLRSLWG